MTIERRLYWAAMRIESLLESLHIEERHYELKKMKLPIVDHSLYNLLGKQLFEIYQAHEISEEDQRKIEKICFLLTSFVLEKN